MVEGGTTEKGARGGKDFHLVGTWEEFEALHKALAKFVSQRHEYTRTVSVGDKERFVFQVMPEE